MASQHDIDLREHLKLSDELGMRRVVLYDENGNVLASLPISATSLPLPTNAARETGGNLASIKAKTDNIDIAVSALRDALRGASSKTLTDLDTRLSDIDTGKLEEATFTGRLGEVQASPTANTVLARLKDLLTGIVLAAGTNLIGRVSNSHETSTVYNSTTALTPKFAAFGVATSGTNDILAAVTSKKIRVLAMTAIANAQTDIYFLDNTPTTLYGGSTNKISVAQYGGFVLPFNPVGWFETGSGKKLQVNLSAANRLAGGLTYVEV